MQFYNILLLLSFSLVIFTSYTLTMLNSHIVLLDLLFIEVQISLGIALLSFFLCGCFITLVLELITKFNKKNTER